MGKRVGAGAMVVIIASAVMGCAGARMPERIVTDPAGSFVRVDRDPGATRQHGHAHPASLSPDHLRAFLETIEVESPSGPFFGQRERTSLFDPEDLDFLAPAMAQAFSQAQPDERVVFYLRQSGRMFRPDITTGAVAVTGESVVFTLGHYRRTDVEGTVEESRQANVEREVRADPLHRVFDRDVRLFVRAGASGSVGEAARTVLFPVPVATTPSGK